MTPANNTPTVRFGSSIIGEREDGVSVTATKDTRKAVDTAVNTKKSSVSDGGVFIATVVVDVTPKAAPEGGEHVVRIRENDTIRGNDYVIDDHSLPGTTVRNIDILRYVEETAVRYFLKEQAPEPGL